MIFIDYEEDKVIVTYCYHVVQDSRPPEFVGVPTEVEI
jgi:hypothetical protein